MVWTALAIIAALACLGWVFALVVTVRMTLALEKLSRLSPAEPARWPRLSIIVAACNEAAHIERAVRTMLAQDYPDLELVLVDDRSTDETGAIIDRLAAEDARVRALHLTELPAGWLGKVHALHRGTAVCTGELVLYTDADVRFSQTALRRAVALAEERRLDHLTLIPDLQSESVLVNLCIATALRGIAVSQRPWHAQDPKRKEAIGSGAFNLVRKEAFLRTPGFEWLRCEVADDLGLALLMKQAGGRSGVVVGVEDVVVPWYETLGQVFRGMEKNAFAQLARFSVARGVIASAGFAFGTLAPFLTFLDLGVPWLWGFGAAALAASAANSLVLWRGLGFSPVATFASAPLGDLLLAALIFRASILGGARGGLVWRGTLYPTATLKQGVRVRF